jgi:predicted porin
VTRKFRTARWLQTSAGLAALAGCLLTTGRASAEVTIAKGDTWDAFVSGRVGAFLSYSFGDGYPVPLQAGSMIQTGGGVDSSTPPRDTVLPTDAMGMPDPTKQGTIKKMRMRSGYYPNILTLGVHKAFGEQLKLTAQLSIWGTIESAYYGKESGRAEYQPANGTRDNGVNADFREGYLKLEGSHWGELKAGRFMGLYSRGLTEMDAMYAHGYGAGFPMVSRSFNLPIAGDLTYPGPTAGMTGFGILSATYSAGAVYSTPSLGGLKAALGLFDGSSYVTAAWGANRSVRPEAELSYDLHTDSVALHVFGSGGFQGLSNGGSRYTTSIWGASYGARLELGPVHIGGGGFLGKGAGIDYAFDDNPALSSTSSMRADTDPATGTVTMTKDFQIRNTRGFVGIVQVVLGPVDVSAGVGQTIVLQVPADKAAAAMFSTLKTQTGISAGVVYHLSESLHLDVDFINGAYKWYGGEKQSLNVLNAGVTLTF